MSINSNWYSKNTTQSKISNLNNAVFVNEQILGFQIPVKHSTTVTIQNTFENLKKIYDNTLINVSCILHIIYHVLSLQSLNPQKTNHAYLMAIRLDECFIHELPGWDTIHVFFQVH